MHGNDEVLARLQQAGKSYGKLRALDGLDLSLRAGQVTSLLGANGAGKTTAIGLLLGLLRADSGTVELFGRDPREIAARRQIGVMLQTAGLPERLRVGELLSQARSYYPNARSIADCVALAGLDGLLDRALRQAVRRPAAARAVRHRGLRPAAPAVPRRAHHRPRHRCPPEALAGDPRTGRAGQRRAADHPLPGRGRSVVGPRGRARPRQAGRRRQRRARSARMSRSDACAASPRSMQM